MPAPPTIHLPPPPARWNEPPSTLTAEAAMWKPAECWSLLPVPVESAVQPESVQFGAAISNPLPALSWASPPSAPCGRSSGRLRPGFER
ncbi:hypothetical protein [Micromonospora sp. NPDC023814]|uniref:hypothetical protein n=1 Tax=Micromonospora sp. NPDC023814 TaxID=3154596 RepID=UPI003406B24D